jgi:hypothetical protein
MAMTASTEGAGSQLSVVLKPTRKLPVRLWIRPTGVSEAETAGIAVSTTVTRARHEEAFPESSVDVNVTGVVPRVKRAGALLPSTGYPAQASVAEAPAKKDESCGSVAGTPEWDEHSATVSAGHVMTGATASVSVNR